jgi:uncharacterized membrane protein YcaP (DUF421 family)
MYDFINSIFGLEIPSSALTLGNLIARAFLIYTGGMFLLRIQSQFMGINTPFNFMLHFILGSLLANAIVGEGPFFAITSMCLFIAFLNWFIAVLCFYFPQAERVFKGESETLVKDGKIVWSNMRKNLITKDELMESVHKHTQRTTLGHVKRAYFENSGEITVIEKR